MSLPNAFTIQVASPCAGVVKVFRIKSKYIGSSGVILAAELVYRNVRWEVDLAWEEASACEEQTYAQMTPDALDPSGAYGLLVGGGFTPDLTAGQLNVP